MRIRFEREVDIAVPAAVVWDHVVDWPRQGDWIPQTHVENVDSADGLGGRFRAWSGIGRVSPGATRAVSRHGVGFWDPMTITAWERTPDGGGRCEVLHLGAVVKGEGEFTVVARGEHASRFVWAELVVLPLGRLGALGWPLVRPLVARLIDRGLRTMRDQVEASARPAAGQPPGFRSGNRLAGSGGPGRPRFRALPTGAPGSPWRSCGAQPARARSGRFDGRCSRGLLASRGRPATATCSSGPNHP